MFQKSMYRIAVTVAIFGCTLCSVVELHAETIVRHDRVRHESMRTERKEPFIPSDTTMSSPATDEVFTPPPPTTSSPEIKTDRIAPSPSTESVQTTEEKTKNTESQTQDVRPPKKTESEDTDKKSSITQMNKSTEENNASTQNPVISAQPLQTVQNKEIMRPRMQSDSFKPMPYEEALRYQQAHGKDIVVSNYTTKDKYGNKNTERIFDFLGKKGFVNSGGSISGISNTSALRLTVNYGFANDPEPPSVSLSWGGGFDGPPQNGFAPTGLNVVFSDGDVKSLDLQGYNYSAQWVTGLLYTSISHFYSGSILLSPFDVYGMTHHGSVAAAHLTTGDGGMRHLFYSGDKNRKQKEQMTRGLNHIAKMMDVNENTIEIVADAAERNRKETLKQEIREEVLQEQERARLKAEILEEIRREQNGAG